MYHICFEFVCLPWSEVCSARVTSLLLFIIIIIVCITVLLYYDCDLVIIVYITVLPYALLRILFLLFV